MKILQILPGFTVGGPSISTTSLAKELMKFGHEVQFHTASNDYSEYPELDYHPYHIPKIPYNGQFAFSSELYRNLKRECKDAEIIQTNSLWQFSCFAHEFARRGTKAKSVIVPRGTLSEYALSLSSFKKKIVLGLGQRSALKNADMFIATCEREYVDIRRFGLKQPVAIIPNGLDTPHLSKVSKTKTILFLARIHKIKGLDYLIEAWRDIETDKRFSDWILIIAGPQNSDYAREMIIRADGLKRVSFVGEKKDEEKLRLMAESAVYVLPSHSENFAITVAEALSCSTPVITTKGTPWEGVEANNCGKWIDLTKENLKNAMVEMMLKPQEELEEMGRNGREWIKRDFSWSKIADMTIKSYKWLLNPESVEKPQWIRID